MTPTSHSGVDIDAKDELGETPFFKAVQSNSKEVVEFLTENGALAMSHNSGGETPTHIAGKDLSHSLSQLKHCIHVDPSY